MVASSDYEISKELDIVSTCVPTPLRKTREPDISYIVATAHSSYDYKWIVGNARLVVDTRNATKNLVNKEKIVKI